MKYTLKTKHTDGFDINMSVEAAKEIKKYIDEGKSFELKDKNGRLVTIYPEDVEAFE